MHSLVNHWYWNFKLLQFTKKGGEIMNRNIINEVAEVKEVDSDAEANKLLNVGWILLAVIGQSYIDGIHGTKSTIKYSLGRLVKI